MPARRLGAGANSVGVRRMVPRGGWGRRAAAQCVRACVAAALCVGLAACSVIDMTMPPRAYQVNVGSGSVREDTILLNIVRASRSEPLNFVALSKYTGQGTLGVNANVLTKNDGLISAIKNPATAFISSTYGPNNVNVSGNNLFDMTPLETKEFYAGFLAPLDLSGLNLLLHAGISREIVLMSVTQGVRVTRRDGVVFQFNNDPRDDIWSSPGGGKDTTGRSCEAYHQFDAAGGSRYTPPFETEVWTGIHEQDCKYQKFLYFLQLALRYGITTEARELPNPAAGKDKAAPKTVTRLRLCFDPAVARENGALAVQESPEACGATRTLGAGDNEFRFKLDRSVRKIQPIIRSPYGVFQYYGRLLAYEQGKRVQLSYRVGSAAGAPERQLLTVNEGVGLDCFAQASHGGASYCVPAKGARNTKEVFVLLNTLVAMSTSRSALPVTPTFVVTP